MIRTRRKMELIRFLSGGAPAGALTPEEEAFAAQWREQTGALPQNLWQEPPAGLHLILDEESETPWHEEEKISLFALFGGIEQMFAEEGMIFDREDVKITNLPYAESIRVDLGERPVRICMEVSSFMYWSQVVYQQTYLLGKLYFEREEPEKSRRVTWAEELVCSALCYRALRWFAKHWESVRPLSEWALEYQDFFLDYIEEDSQLPGTGFLSKIRGYEALMAFDAEAAEDDRMRDYAEEMTALDKAMEGASFAPLFKLRAFSREGRHILETELYQAAYPDHPGIQYLCDLQKTILEEGKE